jgi:putative ABC transport system permease protein
MDTLLQDLRIAARSLARRPGFAAGAVLTLALGIGAATSIFSVVHGVLLRPLPYPGAERIVSVNRVERDAPAPRQVTTSPALLGELQQRARSFTAVGQYATTHVTVQAGERVDVVPTAVVTPDYFRVLGSDPVLGRGFTAEENVPGGPRAAVISYGFWQERFGGRHDALGELVTLASGSTWPIVGVAPPGFEHPSDTRLWLPLRPGPDEGHGVVYMYTLARLAPGVTLEQARQETREIGVALEAEFPDGYRDRTLTLVSLHEVAVGGARTALWVLFGAVMLVVLIACANVANLLLVRGAGRTSELAVRVALGAGRGRIVRQMLTESVLLAAAGGALGLLLALWGVALLPALATDNLPRVGEIGLDARVIGFAVGLVALTTLLFGLVPALHLSRVSIAASMRHGTRSAVHSPVRRAGRFVLLAGQVALSLVLLLGAGLLLRSFDRLQRVELGYDASGITHFTLALPEARYPEPDDAVRTFDELKARMSALPGVERVSYAAGMPLGLVVWASTFERTDRPAAEAGRAPRALLRIVDHDYLATMRMNVVRGRGFDAGDRRGAQPVALISRSTAERYWPGEDALGRSITIAVAVGWPEDAPRTVVGVVEDVRSVELHELADAEVYVPHAQAGAAQATIVVRATAPSAAILAAARDELRVRDPLLALSFPGTLRQLIDDRLAGARFYTLTLSLFAMLAVALAAIGIYGVVAFLVTRRTREIGVRMALGANPGRVIRSVVAEGVAPAAAGVVVGAAAAAAGTRVIASLLYETRAHDPLTYAVAATLLLGVVALACALPARRAAAIPPTVALREE